MEKIRSEHLSENEIEDIVGGRLLRGHAPDVFSHYINCDHCADLVERERDLRSGFRLAAEADAISRRAAADQRWSRLVAFPAPSLAAVALAAFLLSAPMRHSAPGIVQTVELKAHRGTAVAAVARGGPLLLRLDATGAAVDGKVELRIVDAGGREVWSSVPRRENEQWVDTVSQRLARGLYWVRLTEAVTQTPVREYRLDIQ